MLLTTVGVNMMAIVTGSILSEFNLTESMKSVVIDKVTERRIKLLDNLEEQKSSAQALLDGKEYFGVKAVWQTSESGEKTKTTAQRRVRKWFYTNDGSSWYLEVRYGNKPLQLAKGKTAIVIATKDKLVETIDKVIEAVKANELDGAIKVAVDEKRSNKAA
jgi:hypothetical protein